MQRRLLAGAVLGAGEQPGSGTHRHPAPQSVQRLHRDIFEFQRDRVARRKRVQPRRVGVGRVHMLGTQPGWGFRIRFKHPHLHPQRQRSEGQHLSELSAAQNAEGGRRLVAHSVPAWG